MLEKLNILKDKYANKRILLGVDRLDYVKGVPHRLLAFEKLLDENPEFRNNVSYSL